MVVAYVMNYLAIIKVFEYFFDYLVGYKMAVTEVGLMVGNEDEI